MNSRFFWSGEHIPKMQVAGHATGLSEAAPMMSAAQARLFGFDPL